MNFLDDYLEYMNYGDGWGANFVNEEVSSFGGGDGSNWDDAVIFFPLNSQNMQTGGLYGIHEDRGWGLDVFQHIDLKIQE